ncbi:MAG: hypothetical protein NW226_17465 [Microscillaceae bacterium]|nr:hypothetical protein [Microscillaceae bacterium]
MARSTDEIYNQIIAAKDADSELVGVDISSRTNLYRLWAYMTAYIIHLFEELQDVFKDEVQQIRLSRQIGTLKWYAQIAKDFQLGYDLVEFDTGAFGYAIDDPDSRIVTRSSTKKESGTIKLKVAKDVDDSAQQLSAEEFTQFKSYMEEVKFAGDDIEYVNLNPDLLTVVCDVYYNGLFPTSVIDDNLESVINMHLKNIDFGGLLNVNSLIDDIRNATGIEDIVFSTIQAVQGATTTDITREYETIAGYIVLDSLTVSNYYPI